MKVKDILVEPNKLYVNDSFILKFKVEYSWNDLKNNFTYQTLKEKDFREIGGK